jgi:hypothetical protein
MKKLFTTPMKRNSLTPEDEMRQLERELFPLRARERQLLDEISTARAEPVRERGATPVVMMDGRRGLDRIRQAAADKQRDRISAAEANLARTEKKLLEIAPGLTAAVTGLKELHREAETNRVQRCNALVSDAGESAVSSRDEFESQKTKLSDLRRQLAEIDSELHKALTDSSTAIETADERARLLLATGEMPSQAAAPASPATRTNELISKQRTLEAAIRLQERSVEQARRVFAREVIKHLSPAMANTVQRIAEGYAMARAATADADRIRYAFSQATGADEVLPCFVFHAVPVPTDVKDEFEFWLDDMRQQGYEV